MCEARGVIDPLWRRYMDLMIHITWDERTGALPGDTSTDEGLAAAMERWHEQVIATVPADRLLVWNPSDGWGPLCEFLQVDVPADPMPRLNDTPAFREGIIGGAIGAVNDWWDARERPTGGLHGAAAPASAAAETNGRQVSFPSISGAQTAEA
jgi:hypothetical protein